MTGWSQVPPEIRRMIFDYMHENYLLGEHLVTRTWPASVCKEWQSEFEPWTFQRLALDQDRLDDFHRFVSLNHRRRGYVRRIILTVRLDEYRCWTCETEEDGPTAARYASIKSITRSFLMS